MSEEQKEQITPANNDPKTSAGNIVQEDESLNLFASVWVKIEVNDDDEVEMRNDEAAEDSLRTPLMNQAKKRKRDRRRRSKLKGLKCDQCDYKTSYKNCLAVHMLGHTDQKPLRCTQCDYKTRYQVSLKRHIYVKHELKESAVVPKYKCTVCPYETRFKWNLSSHQRKHDLDKQFKCPHCSYFTAYKHNIIKHSQTHKKNEDTMYYCDKCPFSTKYEGHITRHLAKVHFEISEKASRCEYCTFTTKTGWRLNIHKKRSHQDKPVKCSHCDFETMYRCAFKEHKLTHIGVNQSNIQWLDSLFSTDQLNIQNSREIETKSEIRPKDLADTKILKSKDNEESYYYKKPQSAHEINNHYSVDPNCEIALSNIQVIETPSLDRPFKCITCTYSAKFKASVQRHYQRHHTSQNRPYKCLNCDFSTKTKDQIALHNKRSCSDEILNCKICGFTSVFKCQFVMHEKEHYPFKCIQCDYTCKKKHEMEKHFTVIHLGNGLKCKYCDFKATRKESLLCHEVIHTGKKPFQCQLCEYSSVRRQLLENHINRFHKSKMVEKIIDDSKIESLKKTIVISEKSSESGKIEDNYYTNTEPVPN